MVGAFAALKWRLVSSRFRAATGSTKAWIIVGWCVAGLMLATMVLGLSALRSRPAIATTVIVVLFTVQLVAWVLGPLVAFGIDETVDPAKFALLPLRTGTLQRGLLVASLVGYLPAANAVVLLGAAIGLSSSWGLLPVAVLCAAVQLLLCLVISRAASTAMSGLMSGRRGRDLGMVIGSLLFFAYLLLSFVLNQTASSATADTGSSLGTGVTSTSRILAYGPDGALAAIPSMLAAGRGGRLILAAGTAAVVLIGAWRWWSVALQKSLTTASSTTEGSAPVRTADPGAAAKLPVADSLLGMISLVVRRDRILTWRDPMRRMPWFLLAGLAVLWPFLVIKGHGSLFAVAFPSLMAGLQAGNQFGVEGTGLWLHMVAFADRTRARGEALGHAIFTIIPGTVVVVGAVLLHATLRHDLNRVPAALGVCLAMMLGALAVTGYVSARLPYAMRQSRKSMLMNSIPGQKGRTTGASLAAMGGGILVAVPAIVLLVLSLGGSPAWGWAALFVGPICGAAAVLIISNSTASMYLSRAPEILAVVAIGDRS